MLCDNDVFFEFHATQCLIKDKITGKIMLQGRIKNGLYQFQGPNFTTVKEAKVNNSYGMKSTTQIKKKMNSPLDQLNSSVSNLRPRLFFKPQYSSDNCIALNVQSKDLSTWHNKLRHPSRCVLHQILKRCNKSQLVRKLLVNLASLANMEKVINCLFIHHLQRLANL